jgi:hypothetical protein
MTTFKDLIAAALVSMATATSASAQLPPWAISEPGLYEAQFPDRDILNDGALTPAGRLLQLPGGAARVYAASRAYAGMGSAISSFRTPRHHSYDRANPTSGYAGRRDPSR